VVYLRGKGYAAGIADVVRVDADTVTEYAAEVPRRWPCSGCWRRTTADRTGGFGRPRGTAEGGLQSSGRRSPRSSQAIG